MTVNEVEDLHMVPSTPRIQIRNTKGTSLAIQFDHLDVSGEDWIAAFKLTLAFLTFGPKTIDELFNTKLEEE